MDIINQIEQPEVIQNKNGSIQLLFNHMPPLDEHGNEREEDVWDNFDQLLTNHLGVDVIWEDRELFYIPKPNENTINLIKKLFRITA